MKSKNKGLLGLALGTLGVVFGDIGTSPLYAIQTVFSKNGQGLPVTQTNIYGIISLVFWAITLVVCLKYVGFIMRADNRGEGGTLALVARIKNSPLKKHVKWFLILLGVVGVSLFYGDSAITPAISLLSAMEGLRIVAPHLSQFILPITLLIIAFLFSIQRYGSGLLGKLFGPVMLVWFLAIGSGGLWQIWQHPNILVSLSPLPAITFFISQPFVAFIAMGAVVLVITGAETLYADMGHFGRKPISRAWFMLVFPSLILCYMGQGALLLNNPTFSSNPFILLFPESTRFSMLILAIFATFIASQAVISGAFSLTRQAVQLNFLPRMLIRHTSNKTEGQIYLPFVNLVLFISVSLLVLMFGSSEKLAVAYGIAVSGTLAIDTILFIVFMRIVWSKSLAHVLLAIIVFLSIDLLFVTANITRIFRGGWFPIFLAILIFILIQTWIKGQQIVTTQRKKLEGPLQEFINKIHNKKLPIVRVPGQAVYIGHHAGMAPLALHASVDELHELHDNVVIVTVHISNDAHVPEANRAVYNTLKYDDGISQVDLTFGFHDSPNIPRALKSLKILDSELNFNPNDVSYFISQSKIIPTKQKNLAGWRKTLYTLMSHNSLNASDYYRLPTERTIEIRSLINL